MEFDWLVERLVILMRVDYENDYHFGVNSLNLGIGGERMG
jgi:hypothetical protein